MLPSSTQPTHLDNVVCERITDGNSSAAVMVHAGKISENEELEEPITTDEEISQILEDTCKYVEKLGEVTTGVSLATPAHFFDKVKHKSNSIF